jgi:preprotein translocase subunit SecE
MASPAEFVRQVKQEASKVSWPTKKEVGMIAIMVFLVVVVFTIFFGIVDLGISTAIGAILGVK